ncbi:MAG: hypothetical protein KDC34_01450 [Saprospiraceae bacterium]|nr:hypothetical protein [Saprospiraceae bacterium]
MNNFQRLMEEEERRTPPPPPEIKSNLGGTLKIYQFIGQIVELYLPRVMDLFVLLGGGENDPSVKRNDPGAGPTSNREPGTGPRQY